MRQSTRMRQQSGDGDGFKEKAQGFSNKKIINKLMVFEVGSDLQ